MHSVSLSLRPGALPNHLPQLREVSPPTITEVGWIIIPISQAAWLTQ